MELAAAKKRIAELSKELEAHNYRYYVLNDPTVSDFSYDEMMRGAAGTGSSVSLVAAADLADPTGRRCGIQYL